MYLEDIPAMFSGRKREPNEDRWSSAEDCQKGAKDSKGKLPRGGGSDSSGSSIHEQNVKHEIKFVLHTAASRFPTSLLHARVNQGNREHPPLQTGNIHPSKQGTSPVCFLGRMKSYVLPVGSVFRVQRPRFFLAMRSNSRKTRPAPSG